MRELVYWVTPASLSKWIVPERHCFRVPGIQVGYGAPRFNQDDIFKKKINKDTHAGNILMPNIQSADDITDYKEETKFVCDQVYTFAKYRKELCETEMINTKFTEFLEKKHVSGNGTRKMRLCKKLEQFSTDANNRFFQVKVMKEGEGEEGYEEGERTVPALDFPGSMSTYLSKMIYHEIPDSRFRITRWWEKLDDEHVKIHIMKEKMSPKKDGEGKIVNWVPTPHEVDGKTVFPVEYSYKQKVNNINGRAAPKPLKEYLDDVDAGKVGAGD